MDKFNHVLLKSHSFHLWICYTKQLFNKLYDARTSIEISSNRIFGPKYIITIRKNDVFNV